jgi:ABC-type polysaccharide transport system permease subunit
MSTAIIAFFAGIAFAIVLNELAKALGRKMADKELLP